MPEKGKDSIETLIVVVVAIAPCKRQVGGALGRARGTRIEHDTIPRSPLQRSG